MVDKQLGSSARRRLLQGALAAPAVLTLHTGHAAAMASNMRCVNNQVDNPVEPPYQASPSDNYVRIQLWSLRPAAGSTEVRYFVSGDDISALSVGYSNVGNQFLLSGQWKEFDINNPSNDIAVIGSQPVWSDDTVGVMDQDGPWVAVRFTADFMGAEIIGVVGPGSGGSAVAGSCWSSFAQTV